jgi:antitoxin (DNA-binding transcriptional repressor) of toxin-antitoxin stability system
MAVTTEIGARQLGELSKKVQNGNEVLLTQNQKPEARLVPPEASTPKNGATLRVRSLKGHRVLAPPSLRPLSPREPCGEKEKNYSGGKVTQGRALPAEPDFAGLLSGHPYGISVLLAALAEDDISNRAHADVRHENKA